MESQLSPALPLIQSAFSASPTALGWVFSGLMISGAVSTPIVGRLGELYDKCRVLAAVLLSVAFGCLASACAQDLATLVIGQVFQGIGLGAIPLSFALIAEASAPSQVARNNALAVASLTVSTAAGLLSVGPVVGSLGFRGMFLLPLPVLLPAAIYLWATAGRDRASKSVLATGTRIDWSGAVGLTVCIASLLIGLTLVASIGLRSPLTFVAFAVSIAALSVWVVLELRHHAPLIDLRILAQPAVARTAVVALATGFASVGANVALPIMLHASPASGIGLGADTTTIGLLLLPLGVMGATATVVIQLLERFMTMQTIMAAGALTLTCGAALPAVWHADVWQIAAGTGLLGLGVGLVLTAAMTIVAREVPADRTSSIAACVFLIRAIGGVLGAQVTVTIIALSADSSGLIRSAGFAQAFAVSGLVGLAAVVAAVRLPRRNRRSAESLL